MNSKKSFKELNKKQFGKALSVAIVALVMLIAIIWLITTSLGFDISHHEFVHNPIYSQLAILLSTLNILLLVYLLANYLEVYWIAKTNFTLGFILVVIVLLAHAVTSNPLFYSNFGFGAMNGPFAFIPSIFTLLASVILIYLAHE